VAAVRWYALLPFARRLGTDAESSIIAAATIIFHT